MGLEEVVLFVLKSPGIMKDFLRLKGFALFLPLTFRNCQQGTWPSFLVHSECLYTLGVLKGIIPFYWLPYITKGITFVAQMGFFLSGSFLCPFKAISLSGLL